MEILGNGIIQYVDKNSLIISRGNCLYYSKDNGKSWDIWCELPLFFAKSFISRFRWTSRLSRLEVHEIVRINQNYFACFAFGEIFLIDTKTMKIENIRSIRGSRVLSVCSVNEVLYYGEYLYNESRSPICLYSFDIANKTWSQVYQFSDIRHIHGVFWDNFDSNLFVTTGDTDSESAILKFDNNNPQKIVTGSQQFRAVDLIFTKSSIFYATDAPNEINYIYKIDRKDYSVKKIKKIGGPVFWGIKVDNYLFFSTVVEPTKVNRTDAVELWCSKNEGETWDKILELKKDFGNNYFQYGQIKFPNGPGDGKNLWFTPYATTNDHKIVRLSLSDIK